MEEAKIPFVKPCRVGNFKMWRSKMTLTVSPSEEQRRQVAEESGGKKKAVAQKVDIECINISNADGSFSIRIPQTFEMFGMLTVAYQWYKSDDASKKARGQEYLSTVMSNMLYVSCVSNGYYHTGLQAVTQVYVNPDVLSNEDFRVKVTDTIEKFKEWYKDYATSRAEPSAEDERKDEIAEQAMDILEK